MEALQSLHPNTNSFGSHLLLLLQGAQSAHMESSYVSQIPFKKHTPPEQSSAHICLFSAKSHSASPQLDTEQSVGQLPRDSPGISQIPLPQVRTKQSLAQVN